ncbi:MAG: HAD-IIB family hydrolase [bacterium]|nr:HAD-IIB family hydrolase [bacterium]
MTYEALLLDVDKTLIAKPDALPSKKVKDAITQAKDKVKVCLATGRPHRSIEHIIEYLQLTNPCIVSGGAQIVDANNKKMLAEYSMSTQSLYTIANYLEKFSIRYWIQDNGTDYDINEAYKPHKPFVLVVYQAEIATINSILETLPNLHDIATYRVSLYDPTKQDINFTDIRATKQHAVLTLSQIINVNPSRIIGVGDSHNDLPLLSACGLKVAMGNAVEDLKQIADYVCPDIDHDGVADVINKYILV